MFLCYTTGHEHSFYKHLGISRSNLWIVWGKNNLSPISIMRKFYNSSTFCSKIISSAAAIHLVPPHNNGQILHRTAKNTILGFQHAKRVYLSSNLSSNWQNRAEIDRFLLSCSKISVDSYALHYACIGFYTSRGEILWWEYKKSQWSFRWWPV